MGAFMLLAMVMAAGLELRVVEGLNAEVARNGISNQRFTVEVRGPDGRPAPNVIVTFRLNGATGRFLSGLMSESLMTDAKGEASVKGIRFGDVPGGAEIRVTAMAGPGRAELLIPLTISATKLARERPAHVGAKGGHKKWILVAGVAGAAAAGLALRGKSTAAASSYTVAPVVVAPSVGTPVITIGRPQ